MKTLLQELLLFALLLWPTLVHTKQHRICVFGQKKGQIKKCTDFRNDVVDVISFWSVKNVVCHVKAATAVNPPSSPVLLSSAFFLMDDRYITLWHLCLDNKCRLRKKLSYCILFGFIQPPFILFPLTSHKVIVTAIYSVACLNDKDGRKTSATVGLIKVLLSIIHCWRHVWAHCCHILNLDISFLRLNNERPDFMLLSIKAGGKKWGKM